MTSKEQDKLLSYDKNHNIEDNEVDYSIITALFFLEIRIEERCEELKKEKYTMHLSDIDEQE